MCASVSPGSAERYSFRTFSEAQGLADLNVNTVLQDRTGFIWVGTNNGLFRFDGNRFRRFGTSEGLPAHSVSALLETTAGTFWVATEAGISRQTDDRFAPVNTGGIPPERGPETIAEDRAHHGIYLATPGGLLRITSSGSHEWVAGTTGKTVWSVVTDQTGITWFAETSQVCSLSSLSSDRRCYSHEAGVTDDAWGGLAVDRAGTLWLRSAQRLIALPRGETRFQRKDQGLAYASGIGALALDSNGELLVPTGIGLAVPDRKGGTRSGWTIIGARAGLVVSTVSWAVGDREGLTWIGERGGGLACWLGAGDWQNWTTNQGLKSDDVWAIARDHKGNLLVGTNHGVSLLDHGRFRNLIEIGHALSLYRVRAILLDDDDSIWLGAAPGGLFRYDAETGKIRHFDTADGIAPETIYSLARSNDGAVWAGALQGIYRGAREHGRWLFQKQIVDASHPGEQFAQVLPDHGGRVWAAGSEGLAFWSGGAWTRLDYNGAPLGRLGGRLAEAPDGSIWFASGDSIDLVRIRCEGKPCRIDPKHATRDSAPPVTYFLGFDPGGNLWRGTGAGVYALNQGYWTHYTREDGLVWDDSDANAFFADSDNSVWIGTMGGLSHHVSAVGGARVSSRTQIIKVHSGANTADRPSEFRAKYGEGPITIDYAALTFRRPKDISFRYRLNGVDAGWTETSAWEAHYSNLAPGNYLFEVESQTGEGPWAGRPASMKLVVVGPWWMSRWVLATGAALLIVIILLVWRDREEEHRRRERRLAGAVRERTDELQAERVRERDSNAILEMIVANKPLGTVLDAIGDLACGKGGGICCVVLRTGEAQIVVCASGAPRSWQTALMVSGSIPFEAWRTPAISSPAAEPVWRGLVAAMGEPEPDYIVSRLIGSPAMPLGLMLMFYEGGRKPPETAYFDASVRLARIAIEHATMYDNLHRQARHDALTGLPNRLRLEECLELAIRDCDLSQRKLALLYVDLDRFKEINDTLSHRAGDLYLQAIAKRMRKSVRAADIVGRIGGDEFNVIVPLIADRADAEEIAVRVLEEIRRPLTIDGCELHGTASVGIAVYPDDAIAPDELQRKADAAMYSAKASGKNQVQACGHPWATLEPCRMEEEIRAAIDENRLRVDYQPKVSAAGRICGLEALVRLEHPVQGEIGPAQFIPVAEQSGLIVPLGAWVLNEVCRQLADWERRGVRFVPVAVNVSSVQLCRDDFAASVKEVLGIHGIRPSQIELELTESFLIEGGEEARLQMESLRGIGVRFALDDFGAGYSSLSYLHRLNVDSIKLDRSFIQPIADDPAARRLVRAMIGVAEGMGLGVVAEGVETEEQREALVEAGCEFMQGFFFAPPKPAREIEAFLQAGMDGSDGLVELGSAILAGR